MKTYSQKSSEIAREWWIIDASTLPLGKLAVVIADKLMGKSKVTYTPHTDNGDYVVVINAKNLKVTGDKMTDKHYYRHSGFPGGLTRNILMATVAARLQPPLLVSTRAKVNLLSTARPPQITSATIRLFSPK